MSIATGASAAPLRPISFGDPAVTDRAPRRRHHLSQAQKAARRLSGPADRPPAPLGQGGARPRLHGRARGRRLAADHLRAIAGPGQAYRLGAAGARSVRRKADRHSLRQFDRPRAGRVRRALCRHSLLSGVAGLFAGVEGLRQARLPDEAADAGPGVRRRCRQIRRCAVGQCSRGNRNRGVARRRARPQGDDARRVCWRRRSIPASTPRTMPSVRIPSQNSC